MASITFDTLKFVRRLREAGFEGSQAEAVAQAFQDAAGETDLATRQDIELLRRDMDVLRADLRRDGSETKAELIRWVVAVGVLQITLITALLIKLLP